MQLFVLINLFLFSSQAKAKENLHDLHIDCLSAYVSSMENQIPTPRQSQIFMGIERDALRQEYISEDQLQMMHSRAHAAAVSMVCKQLKTTA